MKRIIDKFAIVIDALLSPFVYMSAILLSIIRRYGIHKMRISKRIFMKVGVFPIIDHYYEPLFKSSLIARSLNMDRRLTGMQWNVDEQLNTLRKFNYNDELLQIPMERTEKLEFFYGNGYFGPGDAEYLYNVIRLFRPTMIIEIGSGNSTLMAINAIRSNRAEDIAYECRHICIEPNECAWLEGLDIELVRTRAEKVRLSLFESLGRNDLLFIDSSHVIRPQGDVLFEYLEVLPVLKKGVIVHIHDIFSPKDYPADVIIERVRFWNEQYLLEAFMTMNRDFRIVGALNYLKHKHFAELSAKCPILKMEPHHEPGSFYIVRD